MRLPTPRSLLAPTLCLLLLGAGARAGTLEHIEQSGELRVATPGDYRPYASATARSGPPLGADVTLARTIAAQLAVTPRFVPTSWPALAADAAADRFDLAVGGISITPARRRIAYFSRPTSRDGKTVLAPCADLAVRDTLGELDRPGTRVIVNPGGTNEAFARAHLHRAALLVHSDNVGVFDELLAGRADAMITDATEARLQQALHPGQLCAAHPDRPFERHDKALMLARDPALRARVDAVLAPLDRQGALRANLDRWLAAPWAMLDAPGGRLLVLVDARLALMTEVARYKWNTGGAIEDAQREAELLESLVARAAAAGVPRDRTEVFFRAQFAAARQLQQDLFTLWRAQGRGKLPPAPDLRQALRPELDALSAELVQALAAVREGEVAPAGAVLTTRLISPAAEALALAPLRSGTLTPRKGS